MATTIVVTNAGLDIATNRLGDGGTVPDYLAWGTGGTAAAKTQTALTTEAPEARVQGTVSQETTTVANDTYQVTGSITATADRAITEAGVFDAAAAGNMFTRANFSVVNIDSGDNITFTWKVAHA